PIPCQGLSLDSDSPERAQPDSRQEQAEHSSPTQVWIAQEFTQASRPDASRSYSRLRDSGSNCDNQQSRQYPKKIGVSPLGPRRPARKTRQPGAKDAGRMKDGSRMSAAAHRDRLRDHRRCDPPFTTDADGDEEAQHADLPQLLRERGQ